MTRSQVFSPGDSAHLFGLGVVARFQRRGNGAGLFHRFDQRRRRNPVVVGDHNDRFVVRIVLQKFLDGLIAVGCAHIPVVGARGAAALNVSENRDPALQIEFLFNNLLNLIAGDGISLEIARPFRHNDDVVAAAGEMTFMQQIAHLVFPAGFRGPFRNEDPRGARGNRAHQRQITAVAAHDFDNEDPLMAVCGAAERVDRVGDAMKRGIRSDGHVGIRHIVVDGADHPDNAEFRTGRLLFRRDAAAFHQFRKESGPVLTEFIRSAETAVSSDHHQTVDSALDQILRRFQQTLPRAELLAPCRADDGSSLLHDPGDRGPVHLDDPVLNQSLISLIDRVDIHSEGDSAANHRADRRVHSGGVPAAGKKCDCFFPFFVHSGAP